MVIHKKFLNATLLLIKTFLIAKFDCSKYLVGFIYDIVFINQKQCSLDILKLISIKQIDRNFKLTPPFPNEAGLLSHDFEKELLTKKVTVRKMPYLPPTTNSFASDSYDHQLKKFTKDVSNHTLQGLDP